MLKTSEGPGHKDWLKHHPAAVSQVIREISVMEMEDCEAMRINWENEGIPEDMQRRQENIPLDCHFQLQLN